eukprot:9225805-Pyramimonas_sp.AAC.2
MANVPFFGLQDPCDGEPQQKLLSNITKRPLVHQKDERAVKRPDIVLIFRVRGDEKLPDEFIPLRRKEARREMDKTRKYQDTLGGQRHDGWEPKLLTLVLGTLGEMPVKAKNLLEKWGVRG